MIYFSSTIDGYGFDQNPTQFSAHAQATGNHPQQPPPPYSKTANQHYGGNQQKYFGPYNGTGQTQMGNPAAAAAAMKSPMIRQQYFNMMRKQSNPNQNMMQGMFGAGFNNKASFQNQVSNDRTYKFS